VTAWREPAPSARASGRARHSGRREVPGVSAVRRGRRGRCPQPGRVLRLR
jgi:hypothetical protein